MKTRIVILSLIGAAVMVACNQNSSSSSARVKKITNRRGSNEYFYTADKKVNYIMNSSGTKTNFKFSANMVVQSMVDSASGRSVTSTFYLDGKGLADSVVTRQGAAQYLSVFKHDASGDITEMDQYAEGKLQQVSKNDYKDGNKTATTITDSSGAKLGIIYFDYYLDKANTTDYSNQGMNFIGSESKNLQKKIVRLKPTGDTLGAFNFVYYYDDKGRVAQEAVYRGPMQLDSTSYTYY